MPRQRYAHRQEIKKMAEIILDKINYTYSDGTAYEIQALKDVNLQIHQGEFIGIIGHTGSGKSTLTQLLNGLLRASSGKHLCGWAGHL